MTICFGRFDSKISDLTKTLTTKGYFGSPVNGGTCQACECNGQAEECHHKSGRCHCTTKGIIGEKCQKCDTVNHYFGDPVKGSCYCKSNLIVNINFELFTLELFKK